MRKYDQAANEHVIRYMRRAINDAARNGASRETTANMVADMHNETYAASVVYHAGTDKRAN